MVERLVWIRWSRAACNGTKQLMRWNECIRDVCRHGVGDEEATLTAHTAILLVTVITASITSGANDRRRSASPVAASHRTVEEFAARPGVRVQSTEHVRYLLGIAQMGRFVAAIFATDSRIAEFVFGQAFAASASECARRTSETSRV